MCAVSCHPSPVISFVDVLSIKELTGFNPSNRVSMFHSGRIEAERGTDKLILGYRLCNVECGMWNDSK
jgi:hypothetical protein